jgi:hypothetical protein
MATPARIRNSSICLCTLVDGIGIVLFPVVNIQAPWGDHFSP